MGQMRGFIGLLKDKASLIKAALSLRRSNSPIHAAVVGATSHGSSPPPEHRIAAVLSLGGESRPAARACVVAIMDRLHATRDARVALKCLITLHHIVARGSFILKDQLSFYPAAGGRNFLNLSRFRDGRDPESWELSSWVRWYAGLLECNLSASRLLGIYISFSSSFEIDGNHDGIGEKDVGTGLMNSDLKREIDALVGLVEEICSAPDALLGKFLVHEITSLVVEDYGSTQRQIRARLGECRDRMGDASISSGKAAELGRCLKRLEDCRERLVEMFVNRKRNDAFWDLVRETRAELAKVEEEERERKKMILVRIGRLESTRLGEQRIVWRSQQLGLPYRSQCLSRDRLQLTVSTAMV